MYFVASNEKTTRDKQGPIPIPEYLTPFFEVFNSKFRVFLINPDYETASYWLTLEGKPMELGAFTNNFRSEVKEFNPFLDTTPIETRRIIITAAFESFSFKGMSEDTMEKRLAEYEVFLNVKRRIMKQSYDRSEISITFSSAQQFFCFICSFFCAF